MAIDDKPVLNAWYETDDGNLFRVIAIDEANNKMETQDLDGSIDEMSLDVWEDMAVREVQPPEDWRGSVNDIPSDWKDFLK